MGGSLAMPGVDMKSVDDACITDLEKQVDAWNNELPPLKEFVLPGGSEASARFHLARTSTRNAERRLVSLHKIEPLSDKLPLHTKLLESFIEPSNCICNRLSSSTVLFISVTTGVSSSGVIVIDTVP
mgnify:CR=1 FL=1